MRSFKGLLLLAVCLCLSLSLTAQKITGTITGLVTDQAGAVVPGADVTATNRDNGVVRTAKTGAGGDYAIPDLAAGTYDVSVKQANFREYISKGVQLFVSSTATVNAMLTVGSATEQMTVEANAVQVETATGTVGNVIEGNSVRELPLNGRSFAQLTQLMPGVSPASNFDSKHKGLEAGVDFSVNGNNTTGNVFLVDGVNNNDIGSNRTILIYPSIDAIQEFKILRNSYPPEFGQAMGAVINIVTKGGTNQFHGGAFYFGRNDVLNATDYFNNLNGIGKDKLRRNDYGYNIGGPVVKDKLFFFWSQEWNRELRGAARSAGVPTVAEKNGDFSQLRFDRDGNQCENTPKLYDVPQTSVPGPFSTTGQLLLNLFPDPNIENPSDCHHNWSVSLASPIYWREENIRGDYKLGKTWSLFGRYTQDHWNQNAPSTLGYWGDDNYPSVDPNWVQPGYQATVKLTKLIGNSAVNDFQISYASNRITVSNNNPSVVEAINNSYTPVFGFEPKFLGKDMGYPVFWGGLGNGANDQALWNMGPWKNNEELYILKDDFSKVHGAHTFKVGFLASMNRKNELSGGSSGEAANYWGVDGSSKEEDKKPDSGNGAFNALYDKTFWGFGESKTNPYALTRWRDYEFYYGDTWKLRRNLTLEYGARWSFLRNPYSNKDLISSWQPNLYTGAGGACDGLLVVPGTDPCAANGFTGGTPGPNRSLKENNNHMIAPRLGLAWDPKGDGKMVFRGGIGQFYQRERISNYLYLATNSPFSVAAGGSRHLAGDFTGTLSASASPSWGMDTSNTQPNTWQWNFTFEKELYRDSKLELAYVGNRGGNILSYRDANAVLPENRFAFALQPGDQNPNQFRFAQSFGTISYAQWSAHSNYNALQALYRTKVKSVDAQFAYTWSKSLANTDITNSGNTSNTTTITDSTNQNLDYGPTPIDRRHVFVSNIVYNLPSFKGHGAALRTVAGDWEFAGILQYASGPSETIFGLNGGANGAPGGIQGTGYTANQKPNRVLQDCRSHGGAEHQWYNPNAFTLDNYQIGTFGNSGVGSCSGPGIANTDFSLYKNFKVTERIGLQFRMEFYNLFNKTQFRADQGTLLNTQLASGAVACDSVNTGIQFADATDSDGHVHPNQPFTTACYQHAVNTVGYTFSGFADPVNNQRDPEVPNFISANGQGNFGQVTRTRGPREIQYALKITF